MDYRELKRLQQENVRLTDLNGNQTALMQEFLDQMAEPSVREQIFFIADALFGGQLSLYHPAEAVETPDSDLRWDGRRSGGGGRGVSEEMLTMCYPNSQQLIQEVYTQIRSLLDE